MALETAAAADIPALPSVELTAHPGDLFNIDAALTEEERAIRDTIRAFVDEKILPIIGDCGSTMVPGCAGESLATPRGRIDWHSRSRSRTGMSKRSESD